MLVTTLAVHMTVRQFFFAGLAYVDDVDVEGQILARHRMIQIHVHHAHADLFDGHCTRPEIGLQHHLHARHQFLIAKMLFGDALAKPFTALTIGLGSGHVRLERFAGFTACHRLFKPRDDVAATKQNGQGFTGILRSFQRLLSSFGNGIVETDDTVLFDLHGGLHACGWALATAKRCGNTAQMMKPADCQQRPDAYYRCNGLPSPSPALVIAIVSVLLTACGGSPLRPNRPPPNAPRTDARPVDPARANAVLMRAISLVGIPYRYGGNTPEGGFDCSGLVGYVFRDMLDLRLPRTTRELAKLQGPKIDPARLASGDLVFFGDAGTVSHVGIYVGDGRFVHAPSSGGTVRLDRLDGRWWQTHYSGARRLLF